MTPEKLKQILRYDPKTGKFFWRESGSGRKPDLRAGTRERDGYRRIKIEYKKYREAYLAWLYMTGEGPKDQLDHINRIRDDNRWVNLRAATMKQNNQNRTGKGVRFKNGKWEANIKDRYLGRFSTEEAARQRYQVAREEEYGAFA